MALFFFVNLGDPDHLTLQIVGAIGGMFGGMAWFGTLIAMLATMFSKPEDNIEAELRACTKSSNGPQ